MPPLASALSTDASGPKPLALAGQVGSGRKTVVPTGGVFILTSGLASNYLKTAMGLDL